MKKTLVVGLDAACWPYLDPLLKAGKLETLANLQEDGCWGILRSTMPAHTPTAWTSIITGKNPGKHGIFDHLLPVSGQHKLIPPNSKMRQGTPFWQRLAQAGIRVGLVNVPFTHPPEPVNGFVVCGFGAPASAQDIALPESAQTWLARQFPSFQPIVDPDLLKKGTPTEIFAAESRHQSQQVRIATELADRHEVQVVIINLMLLDHANHKMPALEQVQQSIIQSDADLKLLIDRFQPDNIMLFSDHGSRRVEGTFLLHAWLRDRGYCVQRKRKPAEKRAALNWLLVQWLQDDAHSTTVGARLLRSIIANGVPYLPPPLARRFWKRIEEDVPYAEAYVQFDENIDYQKSRVHPGTSYAGLLYLNLNHQPSGATPKSDERQFVDELIDQLSQLRDPVTGSPLIREIYTAQQLYQGPAADYGPDLILDVSDATCNVLTNFRRGATKEEKKSDYYVLDGREFGRHSNDGIFVFSGPDFNRGPTSAPGTVLDLPATLLHLYEVPIPEDYDGSVLTQVMAPQFLEAHPIRSQPGDDETFDLWQLEQTSDETDELLSHLQALGYIG